MGFAHRETLHFDDGFDAILCKQFFWGRGASGREEQLAFREVPQHVEGLQEGIDALQKNYDLFVFDQTIIKANSTAISFVVLVYHRDHLRNNIIQVYLCMM